MLINLLLVFKHFFLAFFQIILVELKIYWPGPLQQLSFYSFNLFVKVRLQLEKYTKKFLLKYS